MATELAVADRFSPLIILVTNTLRSQHSRRAYSHALGRFLAWLGPLPLTRQSVMAWRASLCDQQASPATINVRLASVRALAREGAANGYLDESAATQIIGIPDVPKRGVRFGNWLTREQIVSLLNAPDKNTTLGLRDYILLGLMFGCGLRRAEAVTITVDQVQRRADRMCIVDLMGKGERIRTTVIPRWLESDLARWIALIGPGSLIRRVMNGAAGPSGITPYAAYKVVEKHAGACGLDIAPHDLRRTFALQSLEGGANLEAIRQALGHASLATTTRYVASGLSLHNPACDFVLGGK